MMGDGILDNYENTILYREVKSYEDAYVYNSDTETINKYIEESKKLKVESSKKRKVTERLISVVGEIIEGGFEVLFSLID
jgi:hypothetical protein